MKIQLLPLAFLTVALNACSESPKPPGENMPVESTKTSATETPSQTCYRYANGKDSVTMRLITQGIEASGDLVYDWFEKDGNVGAFRGRVSGDTLFVDYTFQSEGMESVREAVFLRKEGALIEGSGPREEREGKMVFSDRKELRFDDGLSFSEVACP